MSIISRYGDNKPHLVCNYELYKDDLVLSKNVKNHPNVVNISLRSEKSKEPGEKLPPRELFISRSPEGIFVTIAGFQYEGAVGVFAWKNKLPELVVDDKERENIQLLRNVNMVHVNGLEFAFQKHLGRIENKQTDKIVPEEALKIYEAMLYTVPRW